MSNQYTIGYSPNDFFYVNAENMPSDTECGALSINDPSWIQKCNGINFIDNSGACINQSLCQNKESAQAIKKTKNINNGADGKIMDSTSLFNKTMLTTINLSAGILILGYLIYKNRVATM